MNRCIVLYNRPAGPDAFAWQESETGILKAVESVGEALTRCGVTYRVAGVSQLSDIPTALAGSEPGKTVVLNLVERLDGRASDFNAVPAICAALGLHCTGSPADCLELTFDKWLTKARLQAWGVPVPAGVVVPPDVAVTPAMLGVPRFPVIVKPVSADGSEGIAPESVVGDDEALACAVQRVHEAFRQPALVEEFVVGQELNVAIREVGGEPVPLPISEIDFSLFPPGRPHVVDYAVKWVPGTIPGHVSPRRVPAAITEELAERTRAAALAAWRACGCRGYARVDLRVDAAGQPKVLEVNANPDLSPQSGFRAALAAARIDFADFLQELLRG